MANSIRPEAPSSGSSSAARRNPEDTRASKPALPEARQAQPTQPLLLRHFLEYTDRVVHRTLGAGGAGEDCVGLGFELIDGPEVKEDAKVEDLDKYMKENTCEKVLEEAKKYAKE